MEAGRSSSTVGQSRESLDRGAGILLGIANNGVVKTEDREDEAEILKQIEAGLLNLRSFYREAKPSSIRSGSAKEASSPEGSKGLGSTYCFQQSIYQTRVRWLLQYDRMVYI